MATRRKSPRKSARKARRTPPRKANGQFRKRKK